MPAAPVGLAVDGHAAELVLADLRYLFEAPPVDPLAGAVDGQSGFERLIGELKRHKLPHEPLQLAIRVPPEQAGAPMQDRAGAAWRAFIDAQMRSLDNDRCLHRRELAQSLRIGGLFLMVCLVLSALVDQLSMLPPFVQTLLRESLVIAGWVGLWHPLDLLLYAWWPLRYRTVLLRYVRAAGVTLTA